MNVYIIFLTSLCSVLILWVLSNEQAIKVQLFLISFQPLFAILLIKFLVEFFERDFAGPVSISSLMKFLLLAIDSGWTIILAALAILPYFSFKCRVRKTRKTSNHFFLEVEGVGEDLVSYVMTYIVPLTTLTISSELSDIVGNIILFMLIMCLYIRLDLMYINPILILAGFNIFKVKIPRERTVESATGYSNTRKNELSYKQFYLITKSDIGTMRNRETAGKRTETKTLNRDLFFEIIKQ